jgi:hypothetical protein
MNEVFLHAYQCNKLILGKQYCEYKVLKQDRQNKVLTAMETNIAVILRQNHLNFFRGWEVDGTDLGSSPVVDFGMSSVETLVYITRESQVHLELILH